MISPISFVGLMTVFDHLSFRPRRRRGRRRHNSTSARSRQAYDKMHVEETKFCHPIHVSTISTSTSTSILQSRSPLAFICLLLIIMQLSVTTAIPVDAPHYAFRYPEASSKDGIIFDSSARLPTNLDSRPVLTENTHDYLSDIPPLDPATDVRLRHQQLHKRQADTSASTKTVARATKSFSSASSIAASPTQSSSSTKTSGISSTMSAIESPSSASDSATSTSSGGIETAPMQTNTALPHVFDGGLGTNYTQTSCSNFLKGMINDDTFAKCLPFSLLLQNSLSFFAASRSSSSLDPILTASCNVVFPACSSLMSTYANTLRSSSACAQDYSRENPTVRQAYNGLLSYDPLYHAGCLKGHTTASSSSKSTPSSSSSAASDKDNIKSSSKSTIARRAPNSSPSSSSTSSSMNSSSSSSAATTKAFVTMSTEVVNGGSDYCFTNAVTNTSSPTDSYLYYLPLGIRLPAGATPSCNQCLKDTMSVFATAATNQSQPISLTYVDAAQQVNLQCGPNFVNQTIAATNSKRSGKSSAASSIRKSKSYGSISLAFGLVVYLSL